MPLRLPSRLRTLASAGALLLACAALAPAEAAAPSSATPGDAPRATQPERPPEPPPAIVYVCDDGTRIIARFPDSSLAMLMIGDDRYELKADIAASGVRYVGGKVQFWTHQGNARLTRDGVDTECAPPPEPAAPVAPVAPGKPAGPETPKADDTPASR